MSANLVVAPRFRLRLDHGHGRAVAFPVCAHDVARGGVPGVVLARPRRPDLSSPGRVEGRLDAPLPRRGHAERERDVGLADAALFERQAQLAVQLGRAGEQQHARGFAIQAVDDPHPGTELAFEHGPHAVALLGPASGYDRQSREFVHGNEAGLVEDQRYRGCHGTRDRS